MFKESHGKKLCREDVWNVIGKKTQLSKGKHLVLAGERALDVPVLLKKGAHQHQIVVVDKVGLFTARAKRAWPGICARNENVVQVVSNGFRKTLSSMYLDWCGIISHHNLKMTIVSACEGLRYNGLLACTFYASRDDLPEIKRAVRRFKDPTLGRCHILTKYLFEGSEEYTGGKLALVPFRFINYRNYAGFPMLTYVGRLTKPSKIDGGSVSLAIY